MNPTTAQLAPRWAEHGAAWRDPAGVVAGWEDAGTVDRALLRADVTSGWWDLLDQLEITLLVSREYEHFVAAATVVGGRPHATHLRIPHPSGLAFDPARKTVYVAATRNPNQIFEFAPASRTLPRTDVPQADLDDRPLMPVRSRFFPGALYLHDLAMLGGRLHGNSVGQNAVVELPPEGGHAAVWWPKAIDGRDGPDFGRNYLQLNSIAAGSDLAGSYFTASSATPGRRRPGHRNYAVDGRGVLFSGATREPVAGGLTRPHSARLHAGGVWVANSGYGKLSRLAGDTFTTVADLPGWTRGLGFAGHVAFVGTSRVIPRFRQYAPGLDVKRSVCGIHAVDTGSGEVLGSLRWPYGNQIFAVEAVPRDLTLGFPFHSARPDRERIRRLFYSYDC